MHVIESLGTGGAERLLTVLLPALRQRGVFVMVAVMRDPLDLKDILEAAGISVHPLPLRYKWNLLGSALDLARLARSKDIDIMHAHLYFPAICTALVKLVHLGNAATVVTFHNLAYASGVNKAGPGLRVKKFLASLLYPSGYDCKIAVSKAVAAHYRVSLGLDAIEVVYNPVDLIAIDQRGLQQVSATNAVLHLVVPGRLVHEKGHTDLLQALVRVNAQGPQVRVTLAGGGPLRGELEREIKVYELDGVVSITGVLEHRRMLELIASADLVVIPSRFEGLGLTAIEAMALSKPVIVTAVGGLVEIVDHGVSGIVVPPRDPRSLATAIELLMSQSTLRAQLGNTARKRVAQDFAVPVITEKMFALYSKILTSKPLIGETPSSREQ